MGATNFRFESDSVIKKFQSQVAILFGGYFLQMISLVVKLWRFNRRWRFFLGATISYSIEYHTHIIVSIAGGDSFWGLHSILLLMSLFPHVSIAGGDSFWGLLCDTCSLLWN